MGTPAFEEELCLHGLNLVEQNPTAVVLSFDITLTYRKLWKLCDYVRAGLPYIATHPDLNCPIDGGFMPDIGAMIAFVKTSTGREPDIIIGKPNRAIIDELSRKIHIPVEDLAMVGDRLYTDIALGSTTGITTFLVLCDETHLSDLAGSPYQPDYIFNSLGEIAEQLLK